jgi:hypothetical protein
VARTNLLLLIISRWGKVRSRVSYVASRTSKHRDVGSENMFATYRKAVSREPIGERVVGSPGEQEGDKRAEETSLISPYLQK